jgi:DNA-binding MarR family transcriptional regulator
MSHHTRHLARLLPVLRHAAAHLGVEQTPTGKRLGLTNTRVMALVIIDATPECSMTELARALDLPAPLATRVVVELNDRGLVERFAHDADRRKVLLRLTPEGRSAVVAARAEAEAQVESVVERMSEDEIAALVTGLEAFLRVLHEPSPEVAELPAHSHAGLDDPPPMRRPARRKEEA